MKSGVLFGGLFSLIVVGVILFSTGLSYSADIDEINRAIQSRGLNWVAGETPLSHLTADEMKGWTGALEPSPPYTNLPVDQSLDLPGGLPSSFDWTNNNGNYVTSVKSQGGCGGCWAFATTGALEAKMLINLNLNKDLAEQIVISCTDSMTPATDNKPNNCTSGGYMETAADFIQNTGTNLESFYPFTQGNGSCGNASSGWQTDTYQIDSWSLVYQWNSPDITALKNAVQQHGPVVVWMKVFQDFQSYTGGVYHYTTGSYAGNHFVLVIGWDDAKSAFHVKNSWDTNWGESGLFWMAYSEFGNNSQTQFARGAMYFGNAVHTSPTPQCDYVIDFYPVFYSGKEIDDGYYSTSIGDSGWELVVCGNYFGNTSDWFSGDLYDNSGYRTTIYGTIVWNKPAGPTSAYIQGTAVESGSDLYTFYMDGTIKYSRGKYTFSSKAGETYTNGGSPWIVLLSSFKSTTGYVMDKDAKKDRGAKVGKKGKSIWKKVE